MANELEGRRVAILVTDGFEQVELTEPKKALEAAGAEVTIVAPGDGDSVKGWDKTDWGQAVPVGLALDRANPADFDALELPGGVMNPDFLRLNDKAIAFIRAFFEADKPVAVICHGPWTLIDAGAAKGRTLTSWPSLKVDLQNAGANWVDQEVVVDGKLVSSRKPDDLPAFNKKMIEVFAAN